LPTLFASGRTHVLDIKRLLQSETQAFIREHEHVDPYQLALKAGSYPAIPIKDVVGQIQSRQKAKSKLPEWYNTSNIVFPASQLLEQSSSQETAKFKAALIDGKSLADLTGGTGVDTYYFSHKFERIVYNEPEGELVELASHNFNQLEVPHITISHLSAEEFIARNQTLHEWYYLDPSRRVEGKKVTRLADCQPDVKKILPSLLQKSVKVMLKLSPLLDVNLACRELGSVSKVIAVSVSNDCKELLVLLEPGDGPMEFEAVNITGDTSSTFSFLKNDEQQAVVVYQAPRNYLYEPNASILKLGAFKLVASRFKLFKLHPNSHLYTSNDLVGNFPGRIFKVIETSPFNWKLLKSRGFEKANITTRNFPHSVENIRKRIGIKDGGDIYLFFTRIHDGSLTSIICKKADHDDAKYK